jgi:hypothetical protein
MLFAPQKASFICGNAATSLGASPHHLPKATSFAATAQHHYGKAVFHPTKSDFT